MNNMISTFFQKYRWVYDKRLPYSTSSFNNPEAKPTKAQPVDGGDPTKRCPQRRRSGGRWRGFNHVALPKKSSSGVNSESVEAEAVAFVLWFLQ